MAYNPKSLQNLKRGGIKAKEAQALGAEAKRKKKSMREWADIFGSKEVDVTLAKLPDGTKITEKTDFDGAVVFAMYQQAINKGNTKAAKLLMELRGELIDKHEVTGADGAPLFTGFRDILPQMPNIEKIIAERDKEHEEE